MLRTLILIAGFVAGAGLCGILPAAIGLAFGWLRRQPGEVVPPGETTLWFTGALGAIGGGYLADRRFHKTRRYDPDYDDRPPTDPA